MFALFDGTVGVLLPAATFAEVVLPPPLLAPHVLLLLVLV